MTSWDPSATQTVNQLIAGTGVTLSPTSGQGVVTINSSGGGGGVSSLIAGTGITLSPSSGLGNVTVNSTGLTNPLATTLNANNNNITNVSTILFNGGGVIKDYSPGIHLFDIDGCNCAQARFINGAANVVLLPGGDVYFGGNLHNYGVLDMNGNNIINANSITAGASAVTISNSVGATMNYNTDGSIYLQTTGANKNVYINGTLNMNGCNISAGATQLLSIGTNTSPAPNNITFSNYGGTLGDIKMNAYNITIGDGESGTILLNGGSGGYAITNAAFIRLNGAIDAYSNSMTNVTNFSRILIGTAINQPIIQYSTIQGSGVSGTVTVTMPTRYTSQASYLAFANMIDAPAAQLFVSTISRGSFIIGWTSAGTGTQTFAWNTMGT